VYSLSIGISLIRRFFAIQSGETLVGGEYKKRIFRRYFRKQLRDLAEFERSLWMNGDGLKSAVNHLRTVNECYESWYRRNMPDSIRIPAATEIVWDKRFNY
jgi:hypothetical protein